MTRGRSRVQSSAWTSFFLFFSPPRPSPHSPRQHIQRWASLAHFGGSYGHFRGMLGKWEKNGTEKNKSNLTSSFAPAPWSPYPRPDGRRHRRRERDAGEARPRDPVRLCRLPRGCPGTVLKQASAAPKQPCTSLYYSTPSPAMLLRAHPLNRQWRPPLFPQSPACNGSSPSDPI